MSINVTGLDFYSASNTKKREDSTSKEAVSFSDVIREYEEKNRVTAEELKESDDWRNASDEAWDKLLSSVDSFIDSCKEMSKEMVKQQQKAARKASLEASAGMKSIAASRAALAVAACGFFGGTASETEESVSSADGSESDNETDWTRRLGTYDRTVLRKAQLAQELEASAMSRFEDINTENQYLLKTNRAAHNEKDCALKNNLRLVIL